MTETYHARLERLQDRIGYLFGDSAILVQALTHTSYGHEFNQNKPVALRDNERLEFLGDAILDVIVSDILLGVFPQANEGQLSKMRAAVVNEKTLAQMGRSIRLHECVRLGKGESQTGGAEKPSIISSTLEALIAAIYLDGGFAAAYPVVRFLFAPLFKDQNAADSELFFRDHKTQLQELVQARFKMTPSYHLARTYGPDHAKTFEVEVRMREETLARASGSSKKEAEQNAAKDAIVAVNRLVEGEAPSQA